MAKIVLYNPRSVFYTMPLALVALGSCIDRSRFEVVIVDGRLEADPVAAVLREIEGALLLGITVLTGDPIRDALQVSRAAKARRPDLPVVWGGWHPSLFPLETLNEPSIDVTVRGQGEATFVELVERLAGGGDLGELHGIAFRVDGQAKLNPPRPIVAMDDLPAADYGLLPVERYFSLRSNVKSTTFLRSAAISAAPSAPIRSFTAVAGRPSLRPEWAKRSKRCGSGITSPNWRSKMRLSSPMPSARRKSPSSSCNAISGSTGPPRFALTRVSGSMRRGSLSACARVYVG
jgi:radical SAM superfamily enzyme YgiQ (UPF0313 family)